MEFSQISNWLHQSCLQLSPETNYENLYQAIVCGAPLKHPLHRSLFQQSGLIHIIVVSGSHLVFLSEILRNLHLRSKKIHILLLGLYSLLCQLQAPVFRSYIFFLINTFNEYYRLHIPHFYQHIFTILLCLFFFPDWANSLSFQLSLCASIALSFSKSHIVKCLWVFVCIFPLLGFAGLSWLSILTNITISPLIGGLLFPLSALCFLFPSLTHYNDLLWSFLISSIEILQTFSKNSPTLYLSPTPTLVIWSFLMIMVFLCRKKL